MSKKIYFISGPAGVGKSTTSIELAKSLKKSAYISGDNISNLPVSGYEKPWESLEAKELVWRNLNSIAENFLNSGFDVVIDWIISLEDIHTYAAKILSSDVQVKFIILWTEEDVNLSRDMAREVDVQMGERVKVLRNEFLSEKGQRHHFLDNTKIDINDVVQFIIEDKIFYVN